MSKIKINEFEKSLKLEANKLKNILSEFSEKEKIKNDEIMKLNFEIENKNKNNGIFLIFVIKIFNILKIDYLSNQLNEIMKKNENNNKRNLYENKNNLSKEMIDRSNQFNSEIENLEKKQIIISNYDKNFQNTINELKFQNKLLINENNELNNTINELKRKNNLLNNENDNLNKIISEMKIKNNLLNQEKNELNNHYKNLLMNIEEKEKKIYEENRRKILNLTNFFL